MSKQIATKIQQREVANKQLKLSYQHAMEEEQTEFVERLKTLQDQVRTWIYAGSSLGGRYTIAPLSFTPPRDSSQIHALEICEKYHVLTFAPGPSNKGYEDTLPSHKISLLPFWFLAN